MQLKPLRIIGIVFCVSIPIFVAQLAIRRAIVSKPHLRIVEGKVVDKRISYALSGRTNQNRSYHVEFQLANRLERIAINFPTDRQTYQDSTLYKIDTGKVYKFYLDKTYPTFLNKIAGAQYYLNRGIDLIEDKSSVIFSKSHKFELYAGVFFILLSVGILFYAVKYGKWKNSS